MKNLSSSTASLTAFLTFLMISLFVPCAQATEGPVLTAMRQEMARTMDELRQEEHPPYFLSYSVTEVLGHTITASFGLLVDSSPEKSRILDTDIRVGDYALDNTRQIRGSSFESSGLARGGALPLGDDIGAIRAGIWTATDRQYKSAVERYLKVLTNRAVKIEEEDRSGDFSHEKASSATQPLRTLDLNVPQWEERLRRLSGLFAGHPELYSGTVWMRAEVLNKYFVNSEGTAIQTSEPVIRVFAIANTKADDGMTLPLFRSYFAFSADGLPSEEKMESDIQEMIRLLKDLREAPLFETYSGPAILSGEASGVFFHEIFGHRIEGHRQKDVNSSQTFKNLVGEQILPDFIDVVFDPALRRLGEQDLVGHYLYDDQGIPGKRVVTVRDGVFREFLMSRSPIDRFPNSNGHGRKQPGFGVVSRQSNLLVQSEKQVPFEELRELLREECKKQDKEFGLYFVEIQGGFTFTQRTIPNAFNVQPLVVYKIFADGRPDQLVRGVDLIGTPLTTFKNIVAAADDLGVFNGMCGAESGSVPVSASSPSLLVSTIEVQKKAKSQAKLPILPAPSQAGID